MKKKNKIYKFIGIDDQQEKVRGEVSAENTLEAIKTLRFEMNIQTILEIKIVRNSVFDKPLLSRNKKNKNTDIGKEVRNIVKMPRKSGLSEQFKKAIADFKARNAHVLQVLQGKKMSALDEKELNAAIELAKESIFKSIEDREKAKAPDKMSITVDNTGPQPQGKIIYIQKESAPGMDGYAQIRSTDGAADNIGGDIKYKLEHKDDNKKDIKLDWSIVNKTKPKVRSKMKLKEIVTFSHKMAILLHSGILLVDSLYIVQDTFKRKIVKKAIKGIIEKVQNGRSLSDAMKGYPEMFDEFYIAVIIVGESTGSLANSFDDLSKMYKTRLSVKKKARAASIYPMITFIIMTIMLFAMSKFFIPQFESLFNSSGTKLPALTAFVFKMANAIPNIIMTVVIVIIIHLLLYKYIPVYNKYLNIAKGYISANVPIVKKYTQIMSMYNFSSTMQIMLKNGIGLIDALELSTHVIQNYLYKIQVGSLRGCVIEGLGLADSASQLDKLDQFTVSMIRIGEESGNLALAFQNVNEYQQEALKEYTNTLTEMMVPLITVLMGLIIGPIIIAIYLPLFQMTSGGAVKM